MGEDEPPARLPLRARRSFHDEGGPPVRAAASCAAACRAAVAADTLGRDLAVDPAAEVELLSAETLLRRRELAPEP